jgi:hypothetical protein
MIFILNHASSIMPPVYRRMGGKSKANCIEGKEALIKCGKRGAAGTCLPQRRSDDGDSTFVSYGIRPARWRVFSF